MTDQLETPPLARTPRAGGDPAPGGGVGAPARTPRRRDRLPVGARIALGVVIPVIVLAVWWAVTAAHLLPSYRLPSPAAVVAAGIDLAARGELWPHIQISVQRVILGFLIGGGVGLVAAAIVGLSRVGRALLSPSLAALRAVPSLAWVPLLLLYLGFHENEKVILVAIGAFFPVYTTVGAALAHVDPQLVEAGRAFGRRGVSLLVTVQLPAVVPSVISSLRLALAQSWLFLVAAELLGSSIGLGFLLLDSQNNGRIDRLFLTIILLAVFGKITDALIGVLERVLLRRWA